MKCKYRNMECSGDECEYHSEEEGCEYMAGQAIKQFCKTACSRGMFNPAKCQFKECPMHHYRPEEDK
jgi:hypothetical protein